MADQGADANFIDGHFLSEILKGILNKEIIRYDSEQVYRGVTGESCLTCIKKSRNRRAIENKTRYQPDIKIHRMEGSVGRRVLESLGCDNGEMLMTARDKYGKETDVSKRHAEDGN